MKRIVPALLLAALLAGCRGASPPPAASQTVTAARTDPAATALPAVTASPAAATPGLPGNRELLEAFREIAFTSEYPSGAQRGEIRKWTAPIRLNVHGSPTAEDRMALQRAMDGLNALEGFPGVALVGGGANADIWFVKLEDMDDAVPGYVEGNWGFFTVNDDEGSITGATIAIATDVTDQAARTHLIHEELLQSTGLMQDEYEHPESIFYGEWTTTPEPAPMDWELLRMLYLPDILPDMSEKDAMAKLESIYR